MTKTKPELKSCPFACGGDLVMHDHSPKYVWHEKGCIASGYNLITAWNTRTSTIADDPDTVFMHRETAMGLFKKRADLAALPDKPMTEDEIIDIILLSNPILPHRIEAIQIFNALKADNCLYVKED